MKKIVIGDTVASILVEALQNLRSDLRLEQILLLEKISNGSMSMTDISKKMHNSSKKGHCSTAAATGMVDRWEKKGLVIRVEDPKDRRKVMIQVSKEGEKFFEDLRNQIIEISEELLAQATPAPVAA
jgi:DNA-binding MarR family transcriptional regulator